MEIVTLLGKRGVVFLQFITLNICHISPREEGVKGDLASITKYAGFFIPAHGETSLYLTNYVEDFVQVLRKHFRGGGGSRPMLILLI